jgi:two-component system alkaline phosphatase synthesis response regulator PhoP/two-component system response regulator ResD
LETPLILVADDDAHILELVSFYLRKHAYRVATASDGEEVLARERDLRPDLLVLDIMMPGPDGLQVCRTLRQRGSVPIVLLTARGSDIDKISGLRLGADDYVTKPFNPEELIARIEAILRRSNGGSPNAIPTAMQLGRLELDPARRTVTVDSKPVAVTPREFDLLSTLMRFPGIVLGREQLLDLVWGTAFYAVRTVDVHVARLRDKLSGSGLHIETVWGTGYRLVEGD